MAWFRYRWLQGPFHCISVFLFSLFILSVSQTHTIPPAEEGKVSFRPSESPRTLWIMHHCYHAAAGPLLQWNGLKAWKIYQLVSIKEVATALPATLHARESPLIRTEGHREWERWEMRNGERERYCTDRMEEGERFEREEGGCGIHRWVHSSEHLQNMKYMCDEIPADFFQVKHQTHI